MTKNVFGTGERVTLTTYLQIGSEARGTQVRCTVEAVTKNCGGGLWDSYLLRDQAGAQRHALAYQLSAGWRKTLQELAEELPK